MRDDAGGRQQQPWLFVNCENRMRLPCSCPTTSALSTWLKHANPIPTCISGPRRGGGTRGQGTRLGWGLVEPPCIKTQAARSLLAVLGVIAPSGGPHSKAGVEESRAKPSGLALAHIWGFAGRVRGAPRLHLGSPGLMKRFPALPAVLLEGTPGLFHSLTCAVTSSEVAVATLEVREATCTACLRAARRMRQ